MAGRMAHRAVPATLPGELTVAVPRGSIPVRHFFPWWWRAEVAAPAERESSFPPSATIAAVAVASAATAASVATGMAQAVARAAPPARFKGQVRGVPAEMAISVLLAAGGAAAAAA